MDISQFNEMLNSLPQLLDDPRMEMILDRFIRDMSPKDVYVSRADMKRVLIHDKVLATHFIVTYLVKDGNDKLLGNDGIGNG